MENLYSAKFVFSLGTPFSTLKCLAMHFWCQCLVHSSQHNNILTALSVMSICNSSLVLHSCKHKSHLRAFCNILVGSNFSFLWRCKILVGHLSWTSSSIFQIVPFFREGFHPMQKKLLIQHLYIYVMLKWCIYTNLFVQILGCKKWQKECKEFVQTDTRSSRRDKIISAFGCE